MRRLKRDLDILFAAIALLILWPVFLAVSVLVLVTCGWPVVFTQTRPGYGGRPFRMYKFRTMTNQRDHAGHLLPDDVRLTATGRLLRATSLDELPELINVLIGDMSLVGPRPLLMQYLPRYTPEQARRHAVQPGITGWAQIHGRNAISWEAKFELDLWYVDHWSVWLDLKILGLTVIAVLARKGINSSGYATAPEFQGSKDLPG